MFHNRSLLPAVLIGTRDLSKGMGEPLFCCFSRSSQRTARFLRPTFRVEEKEKSDVDSPNDGVAHHLVMVM